jgi:mannosyltransferase
MRFRKFAIYGLVLGALALRLIGLSSGWLSFDELLSVNFSNHSLAEVVLTVARFDVHPPVYYVQLAFWMLFGTSDQYLILNSVLWGVLAVVGLYLVAERMMRPGPALVAAALLAASPSAVFYSQQVRMYSLIMFLCILSFWFMLRFLETRKTTDLFAMAAGLLAVIYSHGVGLIMIAGISAYAFARAARERQPEIFRKLTLAHAILLVASVPAVVFAANHGVSHTVVPNTRTLINTLRFLLAGIANDASVLTPTLMLAIVMAIALVCLWCRKSRMLFATTVLMPIALVFAISHIVSPIWLDRTLMFTIPFLYLSIALSLDAPARAPHEKRRILRRIGPMLAGVAMLAVLSVEQQTRYRKGDDYRPMALFIAEAARPGDLVVMNTGGLNLWCFLWYFAGPNWGRPLAFHDVNETWRRFLDRLGPDWTRRLGLTPSQRSVIINGVTVTATFIDPIPLPSHDRVFVISPLDGSYLPGPGFEWAADRRFRNFVIEIWTPARASRYNE